MQYVCDAPNGKTWFRIETEGEAVHESRLIGHTVEKYFRREREKAVQSWHPERPNAIERDIGLGFHAQVAAMCRAAELTPRITQRGRQFAAITSLGTEPLSPQVQAWHDCHMPRTDETKIPDDAARDEIVQRRPELKGKSLEAMRRILRREKRLSLRPTRSSKSDSLDEEQRKRLVVSERD